MGLNRTSLAAFIIAMGMLVDNAIVVTDNAQILIKKGMRRRDALIKGSNSFRSGVAGGYADCYIFFFTLVFGAFFVAEMVKPLFIVLAVSLGLSWILALTQTTVFGNFILKENSGDSVKILTIRSSTTGLFLCYGD